MGIESQEKYPEKYYVTVDPDAIKPYLPEYRNEDGTLNGNRVHRESGEIAEILRNRALKEGYSVLYDASMRDYPDFRWYNKMVREAREKGYEPKVAFVWRSKRSLD
ncbi:Zeta toxin [Candidatus Thiomargarita nelsonii]|uniref:Zeta toxin n=1 Tax=Candidatus Thiomargarita nelsonii TaxID=1003181 RepID=A0A176S406_9GAMM|nr:Zeta toxin [Candidatus Thiomargarita nelsonii]